VGRFVQNTITQYLPPAVHYIGFFPHTRVGEVAASVGAISVFLTRKQLRIKGDTLIFLTITNIKGEGCRTFLIHHKLQVNKFMSGYTNLAHRYRSRNLANTVNPRTTNGLCSNNLKLESRRMNRVVVMWSPSLSHWSHAQLLGQFSLDWFSENLANSVCFMRLISLGCFSIIFNNIHS
jgi:hypothetical protein